MAKGSQLSSLKSAKMLCRAHTGLPLLWSSGFVLETSSPTFIVFAHFFTHKPAFFLFSLYFSH